MFDGVVQQIDSPWMIYNRPANRFVASFVGSNNFLPLTRDNMQQRKVLGHALELPDSVRQVQGRCRGLDSAREHFGKCPNGCRQPASGRCGSSVHVHRARTAIDCGRSGTRPDRRADRTECSHDRTPPRRCRQDWGQPRPTCSFRARCHRHTTAMNSPTNPARKTSERYLRIDFWSIISGHRAAHHRPDARLADCPSVADGGSSIQPPMTSRWRITKKS